MLGFVLELMELLLGLWVSFLFAGLCARSSSWGESETAGLETPVKLLVVVKGLSGLGIRSYFCLLSCLRCQSQQILCRRNWRSFECLSAGMGNAEFASRLTGWESLAILTTLRRKIVSSSGQLFLKVIGRSFLFKQWLLLEASEGHSW